MKSFRKRDYCVNSDCPSNYIGKKGLETEPKISYENEIIHCEICGHTSGNVGFLPTNSLLSKSRGLEKNV